MSSYPDGALVRLKYAEARVVELERDLRSATVALDRERGTRRWVELRLNELKGRMLYIHDHCGRREWQKRILDWLKEMGI